MLKPEGLRTWERRLLALGASAALLVGCATLPSDPAASSETAAGASPASAPAAPGSAASAASAVVAAAASAPARRPPSAPLPPAAAASGLRPPGAAPVAAAPNPALRPFAEIVRGATRIDGLFTIWRNNDRVWIELKPSDLNQPFYLSSKLKTGIGERGFFGGAMGDAGIIEFRRVFNQVQLLWRNIGYTANADTPEARAVEAAFSPSLLASTLVLSAPEPTRKSVLVEANALFLADLLSIGMDLQRTYRQGYAFDPRNSAITDVRGTPDLVVIDVLSHFATAAIAVPSGLPNVPVPSAPRTLPDPRSMFLTIHYSLARLPETPMAGRKADPRVGYFDSSVVDFSDDLQRSPRRRFVNRWRLEKSDPQAELSEPVKPIVYWLDKTVPLQYRNAIAEGILEWNKAFERIGFKDAIHVEVQADDADFDTLDFGRASVRWVTNASPNFVANGPSHVDPRSGEILDADITIESFASRDLRAVRTQILGPGRFDGEPPPAEPVANLRGLGSAAPYCTYADQVGEQMAYAADLFDARGDVDPADPANEKFIHDFLKNTTMHEVGHTLGLRHNFRASRAYTPQQLADPAFTAEHGVAGSVMEYAPINLNAADQPRASYGTPFSDTLGPYDYWAIEYAYRPLPEGSAGALELEKIAGRSAEPFLAYGTDEDNTVGLDPETLQFDLGSDVVAFAKKRITIAQELLDRQETRRLPADQDYSVLRRSVSFAVRDVARAAFVLARQIGGVRTVRDFPGTGRDPLTPLPADEQRAALALITTSVLSADSLKISPALQRRLGPDYLERGDALRGFEGSSATDYSMSQQVLDMQRGVLGYLLSDGMATRMLDGAEKAPSGSARALRVGELYEQVARAVWSELASGEEIAPRRRELQRDHANRLANLLLRPSASSRTDTRGLVRVQASSLLVQLRRAEPGRGLSFESRAHLRDSADTLARALTARPERQGV